MIYRRPDPRPKLKFNDMVRLIIIMALLLLLQRRRFENLWTRRLSRVDKMFGSLTLLQVHNTITRTCCNYIYNIIYYIFGYFVLYIGTLDILTWIFKLNK